MIIDCFPFFNEFDLLEIRLSELKDIVDVFVLSEATLTFTGKPKPLFFSENKERFKNFPIHHVVIDNHDGIPANERAMDAGQKQRGVDAMMKEFNPMGDDIVILSDADEIPKAQEIIKATQDDWRVAMIEMDLYYYWLNCRCRSRGGSWRYARLVRPNGKLFDFKSTRNGNSDKDYLDAGWHFSFLTDVEYKIDSWTHAPQYNKPPYNTREHINNCMMKGTDLFGRSRYRKFEFLNELNYLPEYVLQNMKKFEKYIRKPSND